MLLKIYNKLYEKFGSQKWWPVISKNESFEIIIGAILTQNTSWKNVEKAILNLREKELIDAKKLREIDFGKLAGLIKPSGYFNQKADRLKIAAEFFLKNKNPSREELLDVKGIGQETADSILLYAFGKPYFVIDLYTRRILSRIGLCTFDIKYGELQKMFHKELPADAKMFNEYHALLVELAKRHCMKTPVCDGCPIYNVCKRFI